MTDTELLEAARAALGLSARRFAALVGVNERTMRKWQRVGKLPGPMRWACRMVVEGWVYLPAGISAESPQGVVSDAVG